MDNSNDNHDLNALLINGATEFGIDLDSVQVEKFFSYMEIIKSWNEKINLTSIEDDHEVIIKHFLDSLSIYPFILKELMRGKDANVNIIDIGTGAGFPAIPLKIVLNETDITMLDSIDKKIKFLDQCILSLGLNKLRAFHGRAEDYAHNKEHREVYDIAVARAVANLPVLLEYCLPFVKKGGIFIAMKGRSIDEVIGSKKAIDILGGKIEEIKEIVLPFSDNIRNIIIIRKFRQTTTNYPRKAGKPSKMPLI